MQPGTVARGKEQIRNAFHRIAEYFHHSLQVHQPDLRTQSASGDP